MWAWHLLFHKTERVCLFYACKAADWSLKGKAEKWSEIWQRGVAAALPPSHPLRLCWARRGGGFLGMRKAHLSRSAGSGWMWTASPERDYSEPSLDLSWSSGVKEQSPVFSLPGPIRQASINVNLHVCVWVWGKMSTGRYTDTLQVHVPDAPIKTSRVQRNLYTPFTLTHPQLLDQSRPRSVLGIIMAIKDNDSLMCCIDKSH